MKRSITIIAARVFLTLLILTGSALAEVSVIVDGRGNYISTLLLFKENKGQPSYWEPVRSGVPSYLMLNMEGDILGDAKPVFTEHPLNRYPWVVWSHFNGRDFDIVYSRWNGEYWIAPAIVHAGEGDDLEASIAFEPSGILFLAFTKKTETSRIFITAFLNGRWLNPVLVSDPSNNSSNPALIFEQDLFTVAFRTPDGITIIDLSDIVSDSCMGIEEGPNPFPENNPNSGTGGSTTGGIAGRDR
ncbi:MAG: hypothetical protein AB1756_03740 [Acidobacteriota bacterium]